MKNLLKKMPKIVLHLHLDGSLRPASVQRWLEEIGIKKEIDEVKSELMVEKGCTDLNEYLKKFYLPEIVLQSKRNIKSATYEVFEDLSKQNVKYAEIRFAPSKHINKGLSYEEVIEAAIEGMNDAKLKFSISGSLILCCMRGNSEEENLKVVDVAKKFLNEGVSSIDLAGAEALFPTEDYRKIFEKAKDKNVPFTIHAGEAAGIESINNALDFGAKRIGHGIRCIEDNELMNRLREEKIILEICPTSNLQTQAVKGKYPLEQIYKKGILTTISPDNNTVSNTNLIEEYEWILKNTNLTFMDLIQMNINATKGIFVDNKTKVDLIELINNFKNKL